MKAKGDIPQFCVTLDKQGVVRDVTLDGRTLKLVLAYDVEQRVEYRDLQVVTLRFYASALIVRTESVADGSNGNVGANE